MKESHYEAIGTMLIGTIVVSCLVLFGMRKEFETATAGDPQTIIVYNWGDYIDPELITQFEQKQVIKLFMKRSIQMKPC